jgi:hypothetical protein
MLIACARSLSRLSPRSTLLYGFLQVNLYLVTCSLISIFSPPIFALLYLEILHSNSNIPSGFHPRILFIAQGIHPSILPKSISNSHLNIFSAISSKSWSRHSIARNDEGWRLILSSNKHKRELRVHGL